MQPLIAPLYGGRTAHEILAAVAGQAERASYEIVNDYWRGQNKAKNFDAAWRTALHDGFIAGSALSPRNVKAKPATSFETSEPKRASTGAATKNPPSLEVIYRPDPSIIDGRFANNGWLQELPKPLTKVTWDNVALVSPTTAQQLVGDPYNRGGNKGREHHVPMVDLVNQQGQTLRVPVWVMPGQPDGVITIHLG